MGDATGHGFKAGDERTREAARRGRKAQAEAARRRKTLAELTDAALASGLKGEQGAKVRKLFDEFGDDDVTWGAAVVAAQVNEAARGSTKAFEALIEAQGTARAKEAPKGRFTADYGLLLSPPFLAPHRRIWAGEGGDYWFLGGRLSGKSSAVSLEVLGGMMAHPDRSALVMMHVGANMGQSVYEQCLWALDRLGVSEQWRATRSPMELTRVSTGQKVIFRGCDRGEKSKALKAPGSTYFAYQWFEEADQFDGMREIRAVTQSATRGAPSPDAPFFRFYSFNPPRSRDAWANREVTAREAAGLEVFRSTYLDMPAEWVPEQARLDAEALREADEDAYRHEYLGEACGYGAEVFPRAEVRPVTDAERKALDVFGYGVDWGYAADPFVWVKVGYQPATRTLYVLDEFSGHGLGNVESAAEAWRRMGEARRGEGGAVVEDEQPYAAVWCDSAEPKSIDEWCSQGVRAKAAPKQGIHSVRDSIGWLQRRARIVVDPACELSARELMGYQYEVDPSDGSITGRMPDADNHAVDAIRYATTKIREDRRNV